MKRHLIAVLALLMLFAALYGCTQQKSPDTQLAPDAAVKISGDGIDITLTAADMQAREQKTFKCTNVESGGKINEVTVSGFSLRDILAENGVFLDEVGSLNLLASDGYSVIVPSEYYVGFDVYILLGFEGESLEYPRSCIPDQRAMYWVKNLSKIELIGKTGTEKTKEQIVNRIDVFREGLKELEVIMLNYKDSQLPAYSLKAYCEKNNISITHDTVTMIARDGFKKEELADFYLENFVALESNQNTDDMPLYFSETMNGGMRVKQLDYVIWGNRAVYFGDEISVSDLFVAAGMGKAESYVFTADDGFELIVPYDAIEFGKIYTDEEKGFIRAEFDGYDFKDAKGGGKVKYLVSIKIAGDISALYSVK